MTVTVEQDPLRQARQLKSGGPGFEEVGQEERLLAQPGCPRVGREQATELVAEHGGAARLEGDDWNARVDLLSELVHDGLKIRSGVIEHAEVVERPTATQAPCRHDRLESGCAQDADPRLRGLGMKVVVERVYPEKRDVARRRCFAGRCRPAGLRGSLRAR